MWELLLWRRLACRLCGRHPALVATLGALGMAGFVITLVVAIHGWAAAGTPLGLGLSALFSLAGYGLSLLVGYLGDPFELRRREAKWRSAPREKPPQSIPALQID